MAVYNLSGTEIYTCYDIQSSSLVHAYNINGTEVLSGIVRRDWSGISQDYQDTLNARMDYVETYLSNHQNAFAFPVITDAHIYFTGNEPNFIAYHKPRLFSEFLMLGDIANTYDATQLDDAVDYMSGAEQQVNLVSVGNHEWGEYDTTGLDPYPEVWYEELLPSTAVMIADDGLIYYYDDAVNNVRFIMLDSNSTVKKSSGVQLYAMSALNWLASVMESSGSKDIILMNHAMGSGFYLVTDTEQTNWINDTGITNINTMNNIVNAFINRSTVSVTVDGVTNTHDYSGVTGNFIGYFTGHYHNAGYTNVSGFNKFTCLATIRNKTAGRGIEFFIVDKTLRKIIRVLARLADTTFESYEYTY